ncbi:MAG: glycosyltransferase [Anaerolinea sp.]|nr:glycosyltransferase [Anaerolinea sp.]
MKTWNVLRYLADRGHAVTLASFVRADEVAFVPKLQEVCTAVHTIPIHRSRVADVGYFLRSNLTGRPFLIERDDLPGMRRLVQSLLAAESFDVVHADQLTMTQFALDALTVTGKKRPFTVFDAHNATWTISERLLENVPWFLRPLLRLETARIKKYEAMLVTKFDHTMVVIEPDRDALMSGLPTAQHATTARKISVIPIAVDTQTLQPAQRQPNSMNIMTLGSLNYPPNVDGIRWFCREIFPLVRAQMPAVTLTIIGKSPPADLVQLSETYPGVVNVTGYVEDLLPYMEAAALMVVPVRAGSGMRVRLLEAFARAMPAVTTTIGLEGIMATHEQEVLVADTPADFARETVRLLQDQALQQRLAQNGRSLAETRYDWQVALRLMDDVYANAAQG